MDFLRFLGTGVQVPRTGGNGITKLLTTQIAIPMQPPPGIWPRMPRARGVGDPERISERRIASDRWDMSYGMSLEARMDPKARVQTASNSSSALLPFKRLRKVVSDLGCGSGDSG